MDSQSDDPWINKREAVRLIREEASHRQVVPFLGAGVSVAAGFPTIRFVIQYLAKVDFAIRLGVFADRFPDLGGGQQAAETYRRHPSKYLEDFGWPDLGQLDADLWMWLARGAKDDANRRYQGEGRMKVWQESNARVNANRDNPQAILDLLANDITPVPIWSPQPGKAGPRQLELRDHLRAAVQWTLRQDLADREGGTARATLREWKRWKTWYCGRPGSEPDLLYGDWEALLDRLCEGSFDLTDALFTSFEYGRGPTLSHRYLAFLQRKLGMPLVLTTNFDSLLERAMREEGVTPKVFDIHRDAELPDAALVRRQFSVLKLHGSAYGLRLGERLKHPLDADARTDALRYIPRDALVLVMGFSGSERRIMQLLHAVAREESLGASRPRLIWVQGPGSPGPLFGELVAGSGARVRCCRVHHIDTFLHELYFHFANSYQASARGYSTLPGRPQTAGGTSPPPVALAPAGAPPDRAAGDRHLNRRPVHICVADNRAAVPRSTSWASMAAAAFTDSLDRGYTYGYTVVWIDLENHHTVEGIVAEFFDKVRVVDPQAPTCTITDLHSETAAAIEKAVGRIREVFQRGRYVLVLDSVESFGRPQMMHHGMPSYDLYKLAGGADADGFKGRREQLEKEFTSRVSNLAQFIDSLLLLDPAAGRDPADHPFWDSYVVVTVADPRLRYRHRGQESEREPLTFRTVREKLIRPLRELDGRAPAHVTIHRQRTPGYAGLIPDADRTPATPDPSELLPRHWQYHGGDHARAGSRNSVERAKDVVGLVRELRSAAGSETRISPEGTAAFVGLLSVFRRPRTLPMLRSIVERWALRMIPGTSRPVMSREAHDAIDRLLATIVSARASPIGVVAQFHEGGAVWLFREVHEAAYDALTEALHARDWIATWRKRGLPGRPPGTSASGAVIDGLISVTWHLSAARTYYADVFMPTRDIRAFYEYLYHRVAAARTITLLIAIIEADRRRVWGELARDLAEVAASDGARGLGGAALPPLAWYAQVIGVFAPNIASATQEPDPAGQDTRSDAAEPPTAGHAIPDVGRFLALLNDLRRHALETLLMALTRNRLLLRAVATPDTVLAWSRQFLDRELDDIQGTTLRLASGRRSRKTLYDRVSPAPDVQEIIDALRDLFGELQFKARLSKLDFEGMLRDDARGIGPPAGADNLDNLIQALVEERSAAVRAAVRRVHTAARAATPRRPVPAPDVTLRRVCSDLLRTARCLVHLRHAGAGKLTQRVLEATRALPAEGGQALRGVAKRQRRDALELSCKARFAKWPLWQPLLDRSTCDSRLECPELHAAEAESVAYEHTLREMSETNEDDARHRSSALALRARSLYLRGHFRQAHHFLDLASAGLMPERLDHRTAIGVVHLLRAELLALSANEHYGSGSRHDQTCRRGLPEHGHQLATVMLPLAAESLKKIERGEQELGLAEESLRGMAHQTIWLIPLEFGWAQLRLERMLFECESLFWERRPLAATEYLQRSGGLEQLILDGMRRLRGVLDVIPYRLGRRDETGKSWRPDSDASVVQAELMLYKLWRQFFVAGAYHSTLLSSRHANTAYLENGSVADISRHVIPSLTGRAVSGPDAARYRERWKLWCSAMRFEHFGGKVQLVKSLRPDERLPRPRSDSVSLRSAIIQEMRDECGESDVTGMWNTRREKQPTRL